MTPHHSSPDLRRSVSLRIETDRSGVELAFNLNSISPLILLKGLQTDRRSILRSDPEQVFPEVDQEDPEHSVIFIPDASLTLESRRLDISFSEEMTTGIDNSLSRISFSIDEPDTVFLVRGGLIPTFFAFQEGVRHTSIYNTPFGTVELGICASKVRNDLLSSGEIEIAYSADLRGKRIESCRIQISVSQNDPA